jgi:Sugar-transfer associated ATP-grasp
MNVLLYYPRLLVAFLFRPLPTDQVSLTYWNYAHSIFLWNKPWRNSGDTLGMEVLRAHKKSGDPLDPNDPKVKRAVFIGRYVSLLLVLLWPFLAFLLSLRYGRRFFPKWNDLVGTLILFLQRPERSARRNPKALSGMSLFVPLLYIADRTARRWPDHKDEIAAACKQWRLPSPRVFTTADLPLPTGKYFVKPVNSYRGFGCFLTEDPSAYIVDLNWIVQEAVKNDPEIRRYWGTEALGTCRCATLLVGDQEYECVGADLRMPVGDSLIDNPSQWNVGSWVDKTGRLGLLFGKNVPEAGVLCHPTTGIRVEGTILPRFQECVDLALLAHKRLAPRSPFFNSDIALTEQGPMLIEINSSAGFSARFFNEDKPERFVQALCRAIAQASRESPRMEGALQVGSA